MQASFNDDSVQPSSIKGAMGQISPLMFQISNFMQVSGSQQCECDIHLSWSLCIVEL
jgi:hypothetical protein